MSVDIECEGDRLYIYCIPLMNIFYPSMARISLVSMSTSHRWISPLMASTIYEQQHAF